MMWNFLFGFSVIKKQSLHTGYFPKNVYIRCEKKKTCSEAKHKINLMRP